MVEALGLYLKRRDPTRNTLQHGGLGASETQPQGDSVECQLNGMGFFHAECNCFLEVLFQLSRGIGAIYSEQDGRFLEGETVRHALVEDGRLPFDR